LIIQFRFGIVALFKKPWRKKAGGNGVFFLGEISDRKFLQIEK